MCSAHASYLKCRHDAMQDCISAREAGYRAYLGAFLATVLKGVPHGIATVGLTPLAIGQWCATFDETVRIIVAECYRAYVDTRRNASRTIRRGLWGIAEYDQTDDDENGFCDGCERLR